MKLQKGEVPSIVKSNPGISITTIELPATAKVEHWSNFLHQLQMAEGLVVLRGMGMTFWDNEVYLKQQEMFAELAECVDAREMFIINIAKGDTRSASRCPHPLWPACWRSASTRMTQRLVKLGHAVA